MPTARAGSSQCHIPDLVGVSAGYAGSRCEEDIGECRSSPCLSGGDCVERSWAGHYGRVPGLPPAFRYDRAEGYICRCPPGFAGKGRVRAGSGPGQGRGSRRAGQGRARPRAAPFHRPRQNNLHWCAQLCSYREKKVSDLQLTIILTELRSDLPLFYDSLHCLAQPQTTWVWIVCFWGYIVVLSTPPACSF